MKSYFTLVYQGGIANVFDHFHITDTRQEQMTGNPNASERLRVMQADFAACENYCRGLKKGGAIVRVAWCNKAGDIANEIWEFYGFNRAPFSEHFKNVDLTKE